MTYTFTATTPGTRSYYSGTQGDLQVEMGLYGAIIVLPERRSAATARPGLHAANVTARRRTGARTTSGWRQRPTTIPKTCYDREYLFQFSEMDPNIHRAGAGAGHGQRWLRGRRRGLQSGRCHRALPSRRTS